MFSKFLLTTIATLMIATPAIAGGAEKVCTGILTDMRVIGVQLGDCDLNSISEKEFKRITDICGEPSGINSTNETKCRISEVITPPYKIIPPANHSYGASIYIVKKVLKIEKR
jgi:hypothetical protein